MQPQPSAACAAFVGLDWADATHDLCGHARSAAHREFLRLDHRPAAIDAWVQRLRTRFNGPPLAGCLELHQGPLGSARRHDECLGRLPDQPRTVATYREVLTPRRATDDPPAAELQVELLLHHRDQLTPRVPQRPTMRALAPRVDHRQRLVGDQVRLPNRLPRALNNSCPHALQWFQEHDTAIVGDVLSRWPTLNAVQRARRATLESCFRAHHGRTADVITTRLEAIKHAGALTTDDGVIAPHPLRGQARVAQRRVTVPALAAFDPAMAPRAQAPPDCPCLDAWPGAGAVCAPRLLVACGAPRARFPSAEALHTYAGIAPGTERRGTQSGVHWRWPCPTFLRHTFVEGAAESRRHAFWAPVYDQQPRDQGQSHQAAVRALAFQWIRLLCRCGHDRTPSDASTSLQARHRRGSALIQTLAKSSRTTVKKP
jgi:transposase